MVIVIHTSAEVYHLIPLATPAFVAVSAICTAVRGSVPVFFMLSGALLLDREATGRRPYLGKHALRLTGLFFLWSLLYALGSRLAAGSFGSAYSFFYDLAAGHYHMWFLPAMIVCYLFMPPVSCALRGERLAPRYLLLLFFTVVLLCANMNLTPDTALILNRLTLHLRPEYLQYLGYAVWGYYLSTRRFGRRWLYIAPAVFLAVTALTTAGNVWYSIYKGGADGWLFSYFSLPSFLQASSIFCFFLALKDRDFKAVPLVTYLSDCTLGVYLMHPLILNLLERLGLTVDPAFPVSTLLLTTAVLAIACFALTAAAKKIPGVRRLL